MISDEAVEAAYQAFENQVMTEAGPIFEHNLRAALEAAAPFMLASAWDEGEDAGRNNEAADQWYDIERKSNPYRSQA